VEMDTDRVFSVSQLAGALTRSRLETWGTDDGSGKSLRMTFAQYYARFVYDRDFAAASQVTFNAADHRAAKVWGIYPSAIQVTYALPERGAAAASALRLVFEQHEGKWYLTGIIHEGWT